MEALLAAARAGELDEDRARQLTQLGPEVTTLALLAMARRIAEQNAQLVTLREEGHASPATPSGMVPPYAKPSTPQRRKRPGAKPGHPGTRRPRPTRIDRRETHRLKSCPHCGGPVQRCNRRRTRTIEDIPQDIQPIVSEHTIQRDYCPACRKHVEPAVPDALPGATLGHHVVGLTSWFHYGLGVTIDQVIEILQFHLHTRLTAGGLVAAWQRVAEILLAWYQQIGQAARNSAHLHADETGWRVQGRTHWLWCFTNHQHCYYLIDRCRGSPVLQQFFGEAFAGILIHDFWAAYESLNVGDRQYCLVHLLRELEKVDEHNDSAAWRAFAKKLRRVIRDGIRLRKRPDFSPERYPTRIPRLTLRLDALIAEQLSRQAAGEPLDPDVRRLCKRLRYRSDHIFTFLDHPQVAFENNFAERQIRPAVILRKNSQSNRSEKGAATQAVLMSIYRTLKLRGHNPTPTIATALKTYIQTGKLPPLPKPITAEG
ncbi:MAG: IS66 family transposase [bacterium]|nr:IS66 family transposase [bacterium]